MAGGRGVGGKPGAGFLSGGGGENVLELVAGAVTAPRGDGSPGSRTLKGSAGTIYVARVSPQQDAGETEGARQARAEGRVIPQASSSFCCHLKGSGTRSPRFLR